MVCGAPDSLFGPCEESAQNGGPHCGARAVCRHDCQRSAGWRRFCFRGTIFESAGGFETREERCVPCVPCRVSLPRGAVARWKERFRAERLRGFMPGIVAKLSPRSSSAKKPGFSTLLSNRLLTVRLIGAPANWLGIWAFRTVESPASGLAPGFSPIDSGATWPAPTRSLNRRQPTSLDFTSSHRLTTNDSEQQSEEQPVTNKGCAYSSYTNFDNISRENRGVAKPNRREIAVKRNRQDNSKYKPTNYSGRSSQLSVAENR